MNRATRRSATANPEPSSLRQGGRAAQLGEQRGARGTNPALRRLLPETIGHLPPPRSGVGRSVWQPALLSDAYAGHGAVATALGGKGAARARVPLRRRSKTLAGDLGQRGSSSREADGVSLDRARTGYSFRGRLSCESEATVPAWTCPGSRDTGSVVCLLLFERLISTTQRRESELFEGRR